jgi:prevent-host-death family protein
MSECQPEIIDSTTFQRSIGKTLDDCRYEGTSYLITKHGRPFAVLLSIREYNRLQRLAERLEEELMETEQRGRR